MSGKSKKGLDYAGWDTNIFDGDTKIDKLLEAQGWVGFGIYFYLCQMAYKFDGYFYRWSYADSVTTAKRMGGGVRSETVKQTVGLCLQIGLFDKRLFDGDGILTSRGIQRKFCVAMKTRRRRVVIKDYWLLDDEESEGLEMCAANQDLLQANGDLSRTDGDLPHADGPGRKEKRREGKKREENGRAREPFSPSVSRGCAISFFLDRVDPTPAQYTLDALADFEQDLGTDVCVRAIQTALEAGKGRWDYIHGILKNKRKDGIRSLAAWDAKEAERSRQKETPDGTGKGSEPPPEFRVGEWL